MQEADKKKFSVLLSEMMSTVNCEVTPPLFNAWWKSLAQYELSDIEKAMQAVLNETTHRPVPAMVIAKLPNNSGHLGAEEAWARLPKSEHEGAWISEEMAQSWGAAQDLLDRGDFIAGRMAFIETYKRLVSHAKTNSRSAKYFYSGASIGTHDQREQLKLKKTAEAVSMGLIPKMHLEHLQLQIGQTDSDVKRFEKLTGLVLVKK